MTTLVRQPPDSTPDSRWTYEELVRLADRQAELEERLQQLEEKLANS